MPSLGVRLHGVRLNLHSEHQPLVDYAREHLGDLAGAPSADPDLDVRCQWSVGDWDASSNPFAPDGRLERIGKRMLGNADELIWLDTQRMQGLQLRLRRGAASWSFDVAYRYHPKPKHRNELEEYEYKKYFSLMSPLVYYPIFWHLERTLGCTVVHAASLQSPSGAVLIGGLGGVGKTTLSIALSQCPGFTLGAENLTLTDGVHVYPCAEPIRLDPRSLELLGRVEGLTPMRFPEGLKDKHMFLAAGMNGGPPWTPRAVFLPQFSSRHVTRLEPAVAAERFMAMNRLTLEVDDYAWFASAFDMHWPRPGQSARRLAAVEGLTSRAACYHLGVDPTAGVNAAVEDVLRSIA